MADEVGRKCIMAKRILVTCGHLQRNIERYRQILEGDGIELFVPTLKAQQFTAEEMAEFVRDVDVVIAGDDVIDARVLNEGVAGRLKALIKWGIGTDSIDKEAAKALGGPVFNTPGVFSDEVADLALGYLLSLARAIPRIDAEVRAGAWPRFEGMSLAGRVAGVVGLGGIGQAIAVRCRSFGMEVIGSDPFPLSQTVAQTVGIKQLDFDDVLKNSDVLFLACNLTPKNRHMINEATLSKMKQGSMLINVARGPLVDEHATIAALEAGVLSAAGLDVFEVEPLAKDSPLLSMKNVVLGSHGGSSTADAIDRVNRLTIEIARTVLDDRQADLRVYNRVA